MALSPSTAGIYMYDRRSFDDLLQRCKSAAERQHCALPSGSARAYRKWRSDPDYSGGASVGRQCISRRERSTTLLRTLDTMNQLANQTGGLAFYNNSDIGGEVRKAIEDSRVSYMLAVLSFVDDGKGKYHNIKVRVNRPGIELRYRTGYTPRPLNFTGIVDNTAILREADSESFRRDGVGDDGACVVRSWCDNSDSGLEN